MLYSFSNLESGRVVEVNYSMKDAPEIGAVITHEGQLYRRIVSVPQVDAGLAHKQYPYLSEALPDMGGVCEKTGDGRQVVRSKAHENEICAMTNRKRW